MFNFRMMTGGFIPGGGGDLGRPSSALPTSTLELTVKCENLCDKDVFSKSDPFCAMFIKKGGNWYEIGRTETLIDNLNPEWQKKFVVEYSFEERQEVKFEIYDSDSNLSKLSGHDFLGRVESNLGTIVSSGQKFISVLKDAPRSNGGKIFIFPEELKSNKEVVTLQLYAENLDKKDFFGKSDPYFIISKLTPSGSYSVVHRSEVIKNTLNPTWNSFNKPVVELCNGDYERKLKFDVYDWDSDGSHDFIGSFVTTLQELSIAVVEKKSFPCINDAKKKKSSYKNSGVVKVKIFQIQQRLTFVDYIQGGTSLNFSIAIDFTASNGDPRDPRSLHFMDPTGQNQYTIAIRSVGDIVQDYDSDKQFPALGFGARIPPTGAVSHEFFLNMRPDTPYCFGVDGLLAAYYTALQSVSLYGPTNFSPVIEHVARFANAYQDGRQYFVLLILTDGIITDLEATKHSIIRASSLPMSIIIVGVGNEDFSAMEELDSDKQLLRVGGSVAARDIVQFVELRKFVRANTWDKEMLAKEVLHEIPNQLVSWMTQRGIKPLPQRS